MRFCTVAAVASSETSDAVAAQPSCSSFRTSHSCKEHAALALRLFASTAINFADTPPSERNAKSSVLSSS
jgi:hypothetical protein